MIEEDDGNLEARADDARRWTPSAALQKQLVVGAGAALIAGGLFGAGTALDLTEQPQKGFTTALGLQFAAILPQLLVLLTFLSLARETASAGLKRSCVSAIISIWLARALRLADGDFPGMMVLILIPLGILGLASYTWPHLSRIIWAPVLVFALLHRVRAFGNPQLYAWTLGIFILFVVVCFVGFGLYFGISLIRLQRRLGGLAGAVGWTVILKTLFMGGYYLWFFGNMFFHVVGNGPQAGNDMASHVQTVKIVRVVLELTEAFFTALLFVSLRKTMPTDEHYFTDEYGYAPGPDELGKPANRTEDHAPEEEEPEDEEEEETASAVGSTTGSLCPTCGADVPKGADYCKTCGTLFWEQIGPGIGGALLLLGIGGGLLIFVEGIGWKIGGWISLAVGVLAFLAVCGYFIESAKLRRQWREQYPFGEEEDHREY